MRWKARVLACGILAGTTIAGASPAVAGIRSVPAQGGPCPGNRAWPSFAYDPATQDSVLFGGTNWTSTTFRGTWTWNGTAWTQRHPATSPTARRGAAMAYDGATGQLLLFGGDPSPTMSHTGFDGDTWVWDGTDWAQLHPATAPPARQNADMVYDAARGQLVLFGGYDGHYLNDTWTWDGTTWTQQHPADSPSPRDTFSMAYDAAAGNTVLFGGWDGGTRLDDTWTWDGTGWTQLHPGTSPAPRSAGWQSAYDAATSQVVLFGGISGFRIHRDTWTWNGSDWTRATPAAIPAERENGVMTYDSLRDRIVLFGGDNTHSPTGTNVLGSLWEWDGTTWARG